jgi:hypothetical protein
VGASKVGEDWLVSDFAYSAAGGVDRGEDRVCMSADGDTESVGFARTDTGVSAAGGITEGDENGDGGRGGAIEAEGRMKPGRGSSELVSDCARARGTPAPTTVGAEVGAAFAYAKRRGDEGGVKTGNAGIGIDTTGTVRAGAGAGRMLARIGSFTLIGALDVSSEDALGTTTTGVAAGLKETTGAARGDGGPTDRRSGVERAVVISGGAPPGSGGTSIDPGSFAAATAGSASARRMEPPCRRPAHSDSPPPLGCSVRLER